MECTVCGREVKDEKDVWYLDTCSYACSNGAKRLKKLAAWHAMWDGVEHPDRTGFEALADLGVKIR